MSRKKKQTTEFKRYVSSDTFHIKSNTGGVYIEGFANKATVDRGDEIIATDAWELDNFKKNPVILFNHGFDSLGGTPVGKAVSVTPTEEGLFLKVKMSNSQAPGIKMVRDLVEERILKAFSVGFNSKESDTEEREGKRVRVIKKAELFEVSIVGIPMNQDSLFDISEKSLANMSFKDVKTMFLQQRKAERAEEIESVIPEDHAKRQLFFGHVCDEAGINKEQLLDMLAGTAPMSDVVYSVAKTVAKSFDLEESLSQALDNLRDGADPMEVMQALKEEFANAETQEDEEESDGKQGEDESEEETSEGKESEEGDSAGEAEEGGDTPSPQDADGSEKDFQDCVNAKVPGLLEEGMSQEQAVATAISKCQEEGKCVVLNSEEVAKEISAQLDQKRKTIDIENVVKVKQVAESSQNEQAPTTPVKTEPNDDDFGSPYLDAVKQTNVLLGALINEVQKLVSKMDGLTTSIVLESEQDPSKESPQATENGTASAEKVLKDLDLRLKNLGY